MSLTRISNRNIYAAMSILCLCNGLGIESIYVYFGFSIGYCVLALKSN
jgi:hypothetical protein